jgi:epoxyqueuosine reductase
MSALEITTSIKRRALDLGFAAAGVARADALTEEGTRLNEWLSRGYEATMEWMARDPKKRSDPREVLPGARSVVSVAMNYYAPVTHSGDARAGKISRYAWGDDYHLIIPERLEQLLEHIRTLIPGVSGLVYVDTGPVMDKAWAVRSGIGWLGKHTNVITQTVGSWVFLGEILLDADLAYDTPITDHCGTCTACLDACPTGAIVEPYVVDASRCLSYWTIEHRGPIDPAIVPDMEGWVFGCDICQDVCPWNKFQQPASESRFLPRPENVAPPLAELATISQEEFSRRFRQNPVKRAKREGLIRNARAVIESQKPSS